MCTDFHMYEYRKKPGDYLAYIVKKKGESSIGRGEAGFACLFRKGQAGFDHVDHRKRRILLR